MPTRLEIHPAEGAWVIRAGGAVIGSLFIIPFFGIPHTLMTSALACLAGSIVLFGRNTG